ncbi:MAG: hypothetical protein JWO85_355 [Candidatus Eremiobacteraeota bacterium]|nr:hypothetical protein [Candidatus Eremiobacteraeota bacterium]
MKPAAAAACALAVLGTLGAAPAVRYGPVPTTPQTAVVKKYVAALRAGRFDEAYGMLTDGERKYFGDAAAYRSVFDADGFALQSAKVVGARGDERGRVFFVRERISFVDHASDERRVIDATIPLGVLPEHGALHVKDPGKPYRAFASASSVEESGLRVTVKKLDFFPDRIDVVVTFANLGDRFVTLLPYNKSVLRDERGGVYRIIATKNWTITDKHLYEGIPLAPNARYTGSLAFSAARLDSAKRTWNLTIAPALRDGADAPFEIVVRIGPPA